MFIVLIKKSRANVRLLFEEKKYIGHFFAFSWIKMTIFAPIR